MNIVKFRKLVAQLEAGKKEVNIAQISEILKVINTLTDGKFYKLIRSLPSRLTKEDFTEPF